MITQIKDGDYVIDKCGRFIAATAVEQLVQRAKNCLKIRAGSFKFDPKLGNHLETLDINLANNDLIKANIIEALAPIRDLEVIDVVRHNNKASDAISLTIYIRTLNQNVTLRI